MGTKNYTEKFEELTKIVKELERGDRTIDRTCRFNNKTLCNL